MEKLINALLNDENGISEEAYNALVEFLGNMADGKDFGGSDGGAGALKVVHSEGERAEKLLAQVKLANATDGRFYYPQG